MTANGVKAQKQFQTWYTSKAENKQNDTAIMDLWHSVESYAWGIIHKMADSYNPTQEDLEDMYQDCITEFYAQIHAYDPFRSAPTTFFDVYFKHAVREYVLQNYRHVSSYDAQQESKIKSAIKALNSKQENINIQTISRMTGISEKVANRIMQKIDKGTFVNIEDVEGVLKAKEKTPEEIVVFKNSFEHVLNVCERVLSEEEKELLYAYIAPGQKTYAPYARLAKQYDTSVYKIKMRIGDVLYKVKNCA